MLTEMGVKYILDSNKKVTTKGQGCTIWTVTEADNEQANEAVNENMATLKDETCESCPRKNWLMIWS